MFRIAAKLRTSVFAVPFTLLAFSVSAEAATVNVAMDFNKGGHVAPEWSLSFSYDSAHTGPITFSDLLSFNLSTLGGRMIDLAWVLDATPQIFNYDVAAAAFLDTGAGQKVWMSVAPSKEGGGFQITHQGGSWHLDDYINQRGNSRSYTANKMTQSAVVTPSPVPLPGAALLLLGGLGSLFVVGSRRKAVAAA